jgi:small subunit ribosomal protein S11
MTEKQITPKEEAKEEKKLEQEIVKEIDAEEKREEKAEEKKEAKKEEPKKEERIAIAYIFSSSNNTMVHITDMAGNTLSRITGGMVTKHSRLKADPTIAMFVAKRAAERARDLGITSLYIRTKAKTGSPGIGPGAHAAVKTLGKEGFRIINILDTTSVPRGGPKKKGGKRGRRV